MSFTVTNNNLQLQLWISVNVRKDGSLGRHGILHGSGSSSAFITREHCTALAIAPEYPTRTRRRTRRRSSQEEDKCASQSFVEKPPTHAGDGRSERPCFQNSKRRSHHFWAKLLSQHAKCGHGREALRAYRQMLEEGVTPTAQIFVTALKACTSLADLACGKEIHGHIIQSAHHSNMFVASTLVHMYAKCGSITDARAVFDAMAYRDVVSWNAMMMGYALRDMGEITLDLYAQMKHEGFVPNDRTFVAALKACGSLAVQEEGKAIAGEGLKRRWLEQGNAIHGEIAERGLETDVFVANTLVDMYAKCGSIKDACCIFDMIPCRTVVSWNVMITAYAQAGMGEPAMELYARMKSEGFVPDDRTFVAVLKACGSLPALKEGKAVVGELLKIRCLEKARTIHAEVAKRGLESDIFVANTLIDLYSKLGYIKHARQAFEKIKHRNVVSWTTMIAGYAQMEMGEMALELYAHMQHEGFTPDNRTFVAALKACISLSALEEVKLVDGKPLKIRCLEQGRAIHAEVTKRGLESDIYVASTLVDMYAKCGSMVDARQVFDRMLYHDVVSWTTMIIGYAQVEMGELALDLYGRMQYEGFTPDSRTFVAALKACVSLAAKEDKTVHGEPLKIRCLKQGRSIHAEIAKRGLESDRYIANTLVDMYAKCGSMVDAYQTFQNMVHRDVVSWNTIIMACAEKEMGELALKLYACLKHEDFEPDDRTFVAVLKACGSLAVQEEAMEIDGELLKVRCLEQGRVIHAEVVKKGFQSNIYVANTLIDMYTKCGSMVDACRVFEDIAHGNIVSWNAIIMGCAEMGKAELALKLYADMQCEDFTPDDHTFVAVLKACGSLAVQEEGTVVDGKLLKLRSLEQGRAIHVEITKSVFERDIYVTNTLVDMYAKCGNMLDACQVFERMMHHNVVSWNAIIMGFARTGMGEVALELFSGMQQEGFTPDECTFIAALKACGGLAVQEEGKVINNEFLKIRCLEQGRAIHRQVAETGLKSDINISNSLLDMYVKCGSMVDARRVFDKMTHHNLVSWNSIITGYAEIEMAELALDLFSKMQLEGFAPNERTFVAALKACGSLASLETGKDIHAQLQTARWECNLFLASCLIDMYGKCGSMLDAQRVFDSLHVKDSVTWSALIAGYCGQGDIDHALDLYKSMQQEGLQPDGVTFISILTVCSHNGFVHEAQLYFQAMCLQYEISPCSKHYKCMVDLLGRAGQLDEAVGIVKKMPFKPDIVTWMTILGACQKWNQVELGKKSFKSATILDESCAAAYVLMKNIFVIADRKEDSAKILGKRVNVQAY